MFCLLLHNYRGEFRRELHCRLAITCRVHKRPTQNVNRPLPVKEFKVPFDKSHYLSLSKTTRQAFEDRFGRDYAQRQRWGIGVSVAPWLSAAVRCASVIARAFQRFELTADKPSDRLFIGEDLLAARVVDFDGDDIRIVGARRAKHAVLDRPLHRQPIRCSA